MMTAKKLLRFFQISALGVAVHSPTKPGRSWKGGFSVGDYIERKRLIEAVREDAINALQYCDPSALELAITDIEEAPAADVRPVVRGRWSEKPYLLGTTNVCSVCGENYGMPHGKYNFCPNCGADMRGE